MPRNNGTPPPLERVDLRLANGWVCRDRDPTKYDWRLAPHCMGMPIADWQPTQ